MRHCNERSTLNTWDLVGFASVQIIGVLTYEDVIERTLRLNINDEKDRTKAIEAVWLRSGDSNSK